MPNGPRSQNKILRGTFSDTLKGAGLRNEQPPMWGWKSPAGVLSPVSLIKAPQEHHRNPSIFVTPGSATNVFLQLKS